MLGPPPHGGSERTHTQAGAAGASAWGRCPGTRRKLGSGDFFPAGLSEPCSSRGNSGMLLTPGTSGEGVQRPQVQQRRAGAPVPTQHPAYVGSRKAPATAHCSPCHPCRPCRCHQSSFPGEGRRGSLASPGRWVLGKPAGACPPGQPTLPAWVGNLSWELGRAREDLMRK